MDDFNPRSREGSDPLLYCCSVSVSLFQSTLPRGERRADCNDWCLSFAISIHAPARGATRSFEYLCGTSYISIHAPARGATTLLGFSTTLQKFQSTLPRGERRLWFLIPRIVRGISIHAPARGATSILSKIHPMFLTISHNASSFSSFPFHSFLPHLLNSSTFCALFQVRISRAFSVYYRFAPKKSTPDL